MMHDISAILCGTIERGLIFSLAVAGMFLSSRILHRDDLTIEGSFGFGGALTALLLINGVHPMICMFMALCAGGFAGLLTALLHTKLRFNHLISGIIVTTALFSINLKLAGANIPLSKVSTIFSLCNVPLIGHALPVLLLFSSLILIGIWRFLQTEIGFLLQATGTNKQFVSIIGKSADRFIILGLVLANMLNALAGSLFVQYVGFFSIWSNVGVLIIALAGLILAETMSSRFGLHIIVGAILFQVVITITFELQLDQDWNKLITALLIISLMLWRKKQVNVRG